MSLKGSRDEATDNATAGIFSEAFKKFGDKGKDKGHHGTTNSNARYVYARMHYIHA